MCEIVDDSADFFADLWNARVFCDFLLGEAFFGE